MKNSYKKIVWVLSVIIFGLSLFIIRSNNIYAWNIYNTRMYDFVEEGNHLKSVTLTFSVPDTLDESICWLGIQEMQFNNGEAVIGDLDDSGRVYSKNYSDINAVIADNDFVSKYGILAFNDSGFPCFGQYSDVGVIFSGLNVPILPGKSYFIYLWRYYNGRIYPVAEVATINGGSINEPNHEEINIDKKTIIERIDIDGTNLSLKVGSKPSFTSRIKDNADKLKLTETFKAIDSLSILSTDEDTSSDSDGLVKDYKYFHILDIELKNSDKYAFDESTKVFVNGVEKSAYLSSGHESITVSNESELIIPENYVEPAKLTTEFIAEQNKIVGDIVVQAIKDGKVKYGSDEVKDAINNALDNGKKISVEVCVSEAVSKSNWVFFFDKSIIDSLNSKIESNKKFGAYYSVNILVFVDGRVAGSIVELEKPISVTIPMPNGLPKLNKGYKREWKVIRYHNSNIQVLDAKQTKDGINFESDKFSAFALVYEDVLDNEDITNEINNINKTSNPNTSDNIMFWVFLTSFSIMGIAGIIIIEKKRIKKGH